MESAVVVSLQADGELADHVDIVACGSTLGNLRRFVSGEEYSFRFLVEKVGNTVFFTRRENSPTEVLVNLKGYGQSFPEAYTTWDLVAKGSYSHHRVLKYQFGGLKFLVRYNADGYLPAGAQDAALRGARPWRALRDPTRAPPAIDDNLVRNFSAAGVSSASPGATSRRLAVEKGGDVVDQSIVFDLKTRAVWKKDKEDTLAIELPRLWVAQVPNFVLAYHKHGIFSDIKIRDVRQEVKNWERNHVADLSRLAALLHRIIEAVSAHPTGKMEVYHTKLGPLEFLEQLPGAGDALSSRTKALWEDALRPGASQG